VSKCRTEVARVLGAVSSQCREYCLPKPASLKIRMNSHPPYLRLDQGWFAGGSIALSLSFVNSASYFKKNLGNEDFKANGLLNSPLMNFTQIPSQMGKSEERLLVIQTSNHCMPSPPIATRFV